MTIEEFMPETLCDGWGFYVDIESAKQVSFKATHAPAPKQKNQITKSMPIPIPAPTQSFAHYCPKQPFMEDTGYISLKSDRLPSMTLEDMINCTKPLTKQSTATSYCNGFFLTAIICFCLFF